MECPFCHQKIPRNTKICPECGRECRNTTLSKSKNYISPSEEPAAFMQSGEDRGKKHQINSTHYLVASLVATLCCCLPLGAVSFAYALGISSSRSKEEALFNARKAKMWIIISVVFGILLYLVPFLLRFIQG